MSKFILQKFIPQKLGNRLAMSYENWIIPPQNESLIEIKRKEFKERTKYLEPKILYSLSAEEKDDLRIQGYFVDLDKKALSDIKSFKLSLNRHFGQYRLLEKNYNFSIYNTKYYYMDQNCLNFQGDPDFFIKMWRVRTPVKRNLLTLFKVLLAVYLHYIYKSRRHRKKRKEMKKFIVANPDKLIHFKY